MEMGGLGQEVLELVFAAQQRHPQGLGEGQAEHFHEALAVHLLVAVVQKNGIGLLGGDSDEVLHIPDRAKTYHKFFSIFHLALYKPFCFVYNGRGIAKFPIGCIISNIAKNAIVALDDSYNVYDQKLAVITNMKIAFYTLGCKTNQYETQAMERLLLDMGHSIGSFEESCDCYVVNTCSVTAVADKKNRAVIRRCRKKNPDAILAVCGCYTQHAADMVKALGVDVIGGSGNRKQFLDDLLSAAAEHEYHQTLDDALRRREFEILPAGGLEERTRAMLKVQDGCVNFCTYCIIPYTRGPIRSAPLELAVEQAKDLAKRGYREIVITGIEIAGWGKDLPGRPPLWQLISAICRAVPEQRIRLGSLEPRVITEEFCRKLQKYPNLCPHFHLSMQSGCDAVLQRMKRKYDTARYYESICLLREFFPGCAITTDMIVAFPGETEEEFRQSLDFIKKCAFADMHIFPYSRRPGTPAAEMPGQLGNAVKEERSREAIAVAEEMRREYRENLIGTTQSVLFEDMEGGYFTGHAPNYVQVYAKGENLHNQIRDVTITEVFKDGVLGSIQSL